MIHIIMALRDTLKTFSVLCYVLSSNDIYVSLQQRAHFHTMHVTFLPKGGTIDDERTAKLLSKVDWLLGD